MRSLGGLMKKAYAGMSFTIASVLANLIGGNMIDLFGVDTMLLAGTVASAVGTVILWFAAEEVKDIERKK